MNFDQQAALETHQSARAELSIGPLTWDVNLAYDAQQYANSLASADSGLHHSRQLHQLGQGENLASLSGNWISPYTEASKLWYAEKKDWKGGVLRRRDCQIVGHYTQMIWSTTTHIGMGNAISASGTTYVVARYSPGGNQIGQSPLHLSGYGRSQTPTHGNPQQPPLENRQARRFSYPSMQEPTPSAVPFHPGPLSHHPLSIPLVPLPQAGPGMPFPGIGPPPFFNPAMLPAHGYHFEPHPPQRLVGPLHPRDFSGDNVIRTGCCTIL